MSCGPGTTTSVTPEDGILTENSVRHPPSTVYSRPVRMRSYAKRIVLATVLVSGCGHAEPFGSTPERNEGPLIPGSPAQITHNVFQDVHPSWLPDGSGILYTFQKSPVENRDQCLAILPPDGGTRLAELCSTSVGHLDSTEVYGSSSVSTTGQLAYSYAQSTPFQLAPDVTQLRVAPLTDPQDFTVVHTMPLDVEGTKVDGIGDLHWLSDTRLVYLAQSIIYTSQGGASRDTTASITKIWPPAPRQSCMTLGAWGSPATPWFGTASCWPWSAASWISRPTPYSEVFRPTPADPCTR